jgi:hypothetical protein
MTMSFIAYEQYDKSKNLTTEGFWVSDGTVLISQTEGNYEDYIKEQKLRPKTDAYKQPSWNDQPNEYIKLIPSEIEGILLAANEKDGMIFEAVTWKDRPGWFSPAVQVLAFKHGDYIEVRERSSIKLVGKCEYDHKMCAIPGTIRDWHRDDLFAQPPNIVTLHTYEWHLLAMATLKMGGRSIERLQHLKFPIINNAEIRHHGFVIDSDPVDFIRLVDLDIPSKIQFLPTNDFCNFDPVI